MTLGGLIERTARRFAAKKLHYGHGTDNPRDEAAFLILRGLGLPFGADLNRPVQAEKVEPLIRKRIAQRIPAAYLLNEAWLDGVPFYVDRRVIIPRSHIAFLLRDLGIAPRRILDLCTGSGCLAILAARAFPQAAVDASDVSKPALAVAERNVRRHKLGQRIRLVQSDLFSGVQKTYDLIISNPPYVSTASMRRLPREYRYEPGIALAGGGQGLDYVRRIVDALPEKLNPGGLLVCEVGENRRAVERAFPAVALEWPRDEVFIAKTANVSGSASKRARA